MMPSPSPKPKSPRSSTTTASTKTTTGKENKVTKTTQNRQTESSRLEERSEDAKARRSFERRIVLMLGVILLFVGAVGASEISRIQVSSKNTPLISRIDEQTAIIKDTVDPEGKRYQRSLKAGAASVQAVNEITVLAAYCAQTHKELGDIKTCVQAEYLLAHPEGP